MVYKYKLRSKKMNEYGYYDYDVLGSFSPLEIGCVIGWGADDREEDGIKRWVVDENI